MTRKATSPRTAPAVSSRSLWKGAISFGLVHIPIGLYAATASTDIDFDWLDKRNMQPVGYKRINKVTGKEVASADIVKGVEFEEGRYVVLSAEEIAAAFPKTTQTIEIEAFVDADDIPFIYLERPYYTAPLHRGGKVYALLREALRKSNKVGVAKVVIQAKQHLAILTPCGRALVLNLLRWGGEIRSFEQLDLPPLDARAAGIKAAEMTMALALIKDMSQAWDADQFRNSFSEEIHQLVQAKAHAGDVQSVPRQQDAPAAPANAAVLDLTALLRSSLGKAGSGAPASAAKEKNTGAAAKAAKAAKAPATRTTPKPRKPASKAPAKRSTSK
ncbi:Ku protein [Delftia acidovorans CCUG 274B]|uniref:non-homologous end joining protein Ku n=1 Tax=Delftia acidovorans TaxID=80866 RepID=UPI000353EAF5|nr:Ku protein [Delftia acidovorans]EPD42774.1 Ku protein [Delftia acidovorans CCUG 274B]